MDIIEESKKIDEAEKAIKKIVKKENLKLDEELTNDLESDKSPFTQDY